MRRASLHERSFPSRPTPRPDAQFETPHVIHDELGRLPARLRAPIVLCYLEGLTHDLAARQLDCPVGTVRSRLARARDLLHQRITRRGLTLSTAGDWRNARNKWQGRRGVRNLPASLVESITRAMIQTVEHKESGFSASIRDDSGRSLERVTIKKIAILSGAISVGAIAFGVAERRTAGQTPEPVPQAIEASNGRPRRASATPAPKEDPHVLAIESKLNERVSMNIDRQPLSDAVSYLQTLLRGVNIVLDPKALSEQGVTRQSPVSLTVKQVPIKTVLKLLLRPLGLTYKIEDDVVLITSPAGIITTYNKTYYVGDLVPPWDAKADPPDIQ